MIRIPNIKKCGKGLLILTIPLLWAMLCVWTAGMIYLLVAHLNPKDASLLTLYEYWFFYQHLPHTQDWILCSLGVSVILWSLPLLLLLPQKPLLYGKARFATASQIRKAGLYAKKGIIVGKTRSFFGLFEKYLILGGSQHVFMAAPTRSGKGVGIVIPNLLTWQDSVVVLDIKQENWHITAPTRQAKGQDCFLLNLAPRDYRSHRWNPLAYISEDKAFALNDIQKIGMMLFPNLQGEAPIWQASSRALWLGMVLYLIETEELPVTLGEVLRQITRGDDYLQEVVDNRMNSDHPLSNECFLALQDYLTTPERTRGSIKKSFLSVLELFYNPLIDSVTSANDFDLRTLRIKPFSIYIGISPDDLERLAPLINLFMQQVIDLNTRELPEHNPQLKYQLLIIADEFTAIGKVPILAKAISYIAGYGIRLLPILQSPAQLREIYGHDASESFMENHALHILFAPKNIKIAEDIAKNIGTHTVKNVSYSKQLIGKASLSESKSDYGRYLLLPQEIKQMGQDKALIIMENFPPILADKIKYYEERFPNPRTSNDISKAGKHNTIQSLVVPLIDPNSRMMGRVDYGKKAGMGGNELKGGNGVEIGSKEKQKMTQTDTLSEQDLQNIAKGYDFEGVL